jgi:HipA-like protein
MLMRSLDIYSNGRRAGKLTEIAPGASYSFVYDKSYLQRSDAEAISATLPLSNKPYLASRLFPFFANMLPEGTNRKIICRENKVDENDLFGLLCCFSGKDIIGAVTVKTSEK